MKNIKTITLILCLLYSIPVISKITTIAIDITAIFFANSMRASGYIGKIDSLRYIASVGHKPSQKALFEALMSMPAQSKITTYNENLPMPLIFSDWLAAIESSSILKDKIQKYFSSKNISDIEKKVLFAIVSMMLTPAHLADIQNYNKQIIALLQKLKNQNLKIYLTGNWTHIQSLKTLFPEIFNLFSGVFISGELHLIKPDAHFYTTVIKKLNIDSNEILWIENEPKFINAAQSLKLNVASFANNNIDTLKIELKRFNVIV